MCIYIHKTVIKHKQFNYFNTPYFKKTLGEEWALLLIQKYNDMSGMRLSLTNGLLY